MDSDSDFEESGANSRGGMSLRFAINRARRYIKRARARGEGRLSGVAGELAETFPCHSRSPARAPSRGSKKRKIQRWRYIPVCLQSPFMSIVPTKGTLDTLCKVGLGSKWLCAEDRLSLGVEVSSEEFYFVVLCLFPPLRNIPYEICKATGPGNSVLIPLPIDNEGLQPKKGYRSSLYFPLVS